MVDFGNCIQFVVDSVTHQRKKAGKASTESIRKSISDFIVLQPERKDKDIESSKDLPTLRLRLIWISPNN